VRAFAAANLGEATPGGAVWFDVFAAFVVWWPADVSFAMIALGFVIAVVAIVRNRRAGRLTLRGTALGVASFVMITLVAALLGIALTRLFGLQARGALFVPHPAPRVAAAWLVGLGAAIAVAALVRRRASFDAVFVGHALSWNVVALALAATLPGAAYLAIVPGLVMAALAAARSRWALGDVAVSAGALVAAAVAFLPFALLGYESLADGALTIVAVMLALVATTFAPLLPETGRPIAIGSVALAAVLAIIAAVVPRQSSSHPRHASIAYVIDGDSGDARWQVDDPPAELRAAAAFAAERRPVAPWAGGAASASVAPAPREPIAPPTVGVTSAGGGDTREVTLDVASSRGAPRLLIGWHSDAETVGFKVNGVSPPPRPARWHGSLAPGWNRIFVLGSKAHVEITMRGPAPADAVVSDISFGLPPSGAPLARARDAAGAVPAHNGDITVVERRLGW